MLYLFNRLKVGGGRMRTAKLFYLFEEELFKNRIIGPTYIMRKFQMGPYNPKIAIDLRNLADKGFLDVKEVYYEKIDDIADIYSYNLKSTRFLKGIEDLMQENSEIFEKFDMIIDIYAKLSGEKLKNIIYSINKAGWKYQRILDYSHKTIILDPYKIINPIKKFELTEDWYDTIEVLLDPDIYSGIQKGIRDAQQGNITNELS